MTERNTEEIMDERYYAQEIFDLVRKTPDKKKLATALSYYHDNDIASVTMIFPYAALPSLNFSVCQRCQ